MDRKIELILSLLLVALLPTSYCQYPYGSEVYSLNPRFFFPFSGGSTSSSTVTVNSPFLITGSDCNGFNLLTWQISAGTCQDYGTCLLKAGRTIGGSCALGLKTCCIPKNLETTLTSPTAVGDRTYEIYPYSNQYCQLRLDFDEFVLGDPVDGDCPTSDRFEVSGNLNSAYDIPILCGQISAPGQHMYLEFDTNASGKRNQPIKLEISASASNSNWRIRTTQIQCTDEANLAPDGCLQYFPASSGNVMSFNYVLSTNVPTVTNQLNNMNYKICLSKTATGVTWEEGDGTLYTFYLTNTPKNDPSLTFTSGSVCISSTGGDYVYIQNGMVGTDLVERICGTQFPTAVIASNVNSPYLLYVTDSTEPVTDINNNGFHLRYTTT